MQIASLLAVGALAVILWPSFALAISVHWLLGLAYGIASFILVISLSIMLLQRAKSERPIGDWLLGS